VAFGRQRLDDVPRGNPVRFMGGKMGIAKSGLRFAAVGAVAALALAACGGGSSSSAGGSSGGAAGEPTKGGTIYYLTNAEQFTQIDPQRIYTGEDLAFFNGTIYRTLTAYKFSADASEGTSLVPDLATDTGTATNGGKTWAFTLVDGATFQDGTPITCADVAYGTSRTFATDVITDGPTYAISMLDIPKDADGTSSYKGPYKKTGQELFDKAVTCSADGKTITFNLNKPVPDFNYTTTLLAFSPVPKAADTGEKYGDNPVASGPYKIASNKNGKGGKLVLARNDKWDPKSDTYRKAYPDAWEVDYGIDVKVIDQRVMTSSGNDQTAINLGVEPEQLAVVFKSPTEAQPQYAGRAISSLDPYVRYFAINTKKVPNLKIRQAIAVALDREALRKNAGGDFAGDYADGVIKPNMGQDYAPTGMWETLLGQKIPDTGDPEYAKKLIAESGEAAPSITFDYPQSPTADKAAAIVVSSLGKAGISAKPNPIEPGQYYGVVFDPEKAHELINAGWGPDWPNASTIIPELFTPSGGFNLSQYDNPEYNKAVDAAKIELDRAKQAKMWQDLNTQAMKDVVVVPTRFGREQRMAGTKVGPIYLWPAYGSWPYGDMYAAK
jgi:peptide/nickel transport system substrate-binding protein